MTEPIRVSSQLIDIVAGGRIRPGDIVSARIVEALPDGLYKMAWNGKSLTAKSSISLHPGQLIKARAEVGEGGIILRLLTPNGLAETFEEGRGELNMTRILESAFLRAGISLPSDGRMRKMTAFLSRTKGPKHRLARLYAEIHSKGAEPTADFLEALQQLLDGDGSDDSRRRRSWDGLPSPEELANEFSTGEEELLTLLSQAYDREDGWKYAALHRNVDDDNINISVRAKGGLKPSLALCIRFRGKSYEFHLNGLDPTSVKAFSDDEISQSAWETLTERLALMNFELDDTLGSMESCDGFPSEEQSAPDFRGRLR